MKNIEVTKTNTAPIGAGIIEGDTAQVVSGKPAPRKKGAKIVPAAPERPKLDERQKNILDCALYYANAYSFGFGDAKYAMIPVHLLRLDESYQRNIDRAHVNELAANWSANECEPLVVNWPDDGVADGMYVVDGQHRMAAATALGIAALPCKIFHKMTKEWEALTFAEQGNRVRIVNTFAKFKALCYAGNAVALATKEACKKYSVATTVTACNTPGHVGGMNALMEITERHGVTMLERVFETIHELGWHAQPSGYNVSLMKAICGAYVTSRNLAMTKKAILEKVGSKSPVLTICEARVDRPDLGQLASLNVYFDIDTNQDVVSA